MQQNSPQDEVAELRRKAELVATEREFSLRPDFNLLDPAEFQKVMHDLNVHQIELEMQNDELRRAQLELEIARSRYFDLYDLAPVGYCTLSANGLILEANLTAATLLGLPRTRIIRQPISRFIFSEDQDEYYLTQRQVEEDGPSLGQELRIVKNDGTTCWVNLTMIIAHELDGALVYRIVLNDISQRKKAEQEKEKLEEQLRQHQKLESIGRLAGGVAHDFNNMLGVIIGQAEMALDEMEPGDPYFESMQEIRNAADRSAKLTRQLLTFARKQMVIPKLINLNEMIESMFSMLKRLIGENIKLEWNPGRNIWPIRMDPSQIDQILVNICINSRDAISGSGFISIGTGHTVFKKPDCQENPEFAPGEYVYLSVKDNGRGIDAEVLTHIFEPFYTTKDQFDGTGLGLATVYGIVKQNKGMITVNSQPAMGTDIQIYFPRDASQTQTSLVNSAKTANPRGSETILLVEDEPSIMKLTATMLTKLGYNVLKAFTSEEAFMHAKEHKGQIHLLISDVIMPEMNGRELAVKLQAILPSMKCLFMSGYSADIISHGGISSDGVHFIQKPFSIAEMATKVRFVLGKVRQTDITKKEPQV